MLHQMFTPNSLFHSYLWILYVMIVEFPTCKSVPKMARESQSEIAVLHSWEEIQRLCASAK